MSMLKRLITTVVCAICLCGVGAALAARTDVNTIPYMQSFENTNGAFWGIGGLANTTNGWYSTTADLSVITNFTYSFTNAVGYPFATNQTKVLQLNTQGAMLSNNLSGQIFGTSGNPTNVYVDTMMQFVANSSTQVTLPAQTKFCLLVNSNNQLVVYHGLLNAGATNIGTVMEPVNVTIDTTQWSRVTVAFVWAQSLSGYFMEAFQVSLNGVLVPTAATNAYLDGWQTTWQSSSAGAMPTPASNGTWFASAYTNYNETISSVGFMGTGYVDDMQVVAGSSPLPLTSYFLTIVSDGNGTNSLTGASLLSSVSVSQGTNITVVYTANQWFCLSSLTSNGTSVVSDPTGKTFGYTSYTQTLSNIQGAISNNVAFVRPSWNASQYLLSSGGTCTPVGTVSVLNGNSTQIVYTANNWFEIGTLSANGSVIGAASNVVAYTQTLFQVQGNISNAVSFYQPSWTITQTIGANGSANPAGTITVLNGDTTQIVYNAAQWFQIGVNQINGADQGQAGQTNATFTFTQVTNNQTVNMTFTRPTWTVTQNVGANGTADGGNPVSVLNGGYVTNTYNATTWYWVQNVSGAGSITGGGLDTPTVTLTAGPITSDIGETVNFYKHQWTISQSIGTDSVFNAAAPFQVNNGDPLSLTYTPDQWYQIDLFKSNGVAQSFSPSGVTLSIANVTGDQSVQVDYTRPLWNVTQYILSSGGTCEPTGTVQVLNGLSTQIVYTATNWFEINTLSSNGVVIGEASNVVVYTQNLVQVQGNVSNAVSFFQPQWTITQLLGPNGTADNASPTITVLNGDSTQIVYNAAQWFEIDTNLVNGVDQSWHGLTNATATFTQVTSNQTINVSFFQPTWTITPTLDGNGYQAGGNPVTVLNGGYATNTYYANLYYQVATITGDGTVQPDGGVGYTNATIVAGPVTGNLAENLAFTRPTRTITLSIPSGNGTCISGPTSVLNGGYATNVFQNSAPWYWVQNVSGAGSITGGGLDTPTVTLTAGPITSDIGETVNFYKHQWTISQSIGTDSVFNAAAPFQVNNGDPLSLTYTPDQWYQIDLFKSNGVAQSFSPSGVTLSIANVTGDQSVQVDYTRPLWNVTQYILSSGGTCEPTGTVQVLNGLSTQIVYTATNWFEINTLSSNGVVIGEASNVVVYTQNLVQVQGNVSNAVSFFQPQWTITQLLGPNGTADNASPTITVLNGDSTQIVYNAAQWFEIDTNLVNGVDQSWHGLTNATATFTQVTSNQTISVSFFQPTWTITQVIGANGTADNTATPITVLNGSSTTIVYTAHDWYNISALSQNATSVPAATGLNTYALSFNTITTDQTASVSFSLLDQGTNTPSGQSGYNVPTTWLTTWTATQIAAVVGGAPAVEKAYLLNIDPTTDTWTFAISKMDVNATTVDVTVKLLVDSNTHTNADGTLNINGTLTLYTGAIGSVTNPIGGAILTNYPGTGEAIYSFGSAGANAFYQAVVK